MSIKTERERERDRQTDRQSETQTETDSGWFVTLYFFQEHTQILWVPAYLTDNLADDLVSGGATVGHRREQNLKFRH